LYGEGDRNGDTGENEMTWNAKGDRDREKEMK
jgi:hypothetical protein